MSKTMKPNLTLSWLLRPLIRRQIRNIATNLAHLQQSHYDALGISSKATQADIKSAYYKLSMVYHPDKNKDSEDALKRFRAISEAYEVLGNVKARKLYDRGLLFGSRATVNMDDDVAMGKFYKSRETKSKPPAAYGRTTVYDFDEWSKAHYGASLIRDLKYKQKERFKMKVEERTKHDIKSERTILLVAVMVFLSFYLIVDPDYDKVDRTSFAMFGSADVVSKPKD